MCKNVIYENIIGCGLWLRLSHEGDNVLNIDSVLRVQRIELTDMSLRDECKFQILVIDIIWEVFYLVCDGPISVVFVPDNLFRLDHRSLIGFTLEHLSSTFCALVDIAIV
jgi:hypothetical protein